MTGILFTGGEGPEKRFIRHILQENPMIVAADSGVERALSMDLQPDLLVGDMDSLTDRSILDRIPRNRIRKFPRDKDETDTEIGLRMLYEAGCDRTVIAGGGGGRLDHLLGILALFERSLHPHEWYTSGEQIFLIDDSCRLSGIRGAQVSFFPLGCETATMRTRGLKWPLDELVWNRGDAGISNLVEADELSITMRTGKLLMVRELPLGDTP